MSSVPDAHNNNGLRKNVLGLWGIVFFVLATNGPLTGLVGVVPTAILMGNGVGLPGAFLLVGAVYLLFAVGFVTMGRYIRNAGAFYAYVAAGLGQPLGTSAAFLAMTAYVGMQVACFGLIGYFGAETLGHLGVQVPWWGVAMAVALSIQYFGTRNIEFNGRFLGLLMLAEILVIGCFDVAVVLKGGGPAGFALDSFQPSNVFGPGLGAAFVFVGGAFMGFETTAIYAEEAKDPTRTLPRATFAALLLIMGFFALSTWLLIVAIGPQQLTATLTADPAIWFTLATSLVGSWLADAMNILLITSVFAVLLSLHNSLSRYLFSLGREGVLWRGFARTSVRQQTPVNASRAQTLLAMLLLACFAIAGLDPMTQVMALGSAPATIGIVAVQVLTSLAVIRFLGRNPAGTTLWQRRIAPLASAVGLAAGLGLIVSHMDLLTGGESSVNLLIPLGMLGIGLLGLGLSLWYRIKRPELYRGLNRLLEEV